MNSRTLTQLAFGAAVLLIAGSCGGASAADLETLRLDSSQEIQRLESDISIRDTKIQDLQSEVDDLETSSNSMSEDVSSLTAEIASLKSTLAESEEALSTSQSATEDALTREQELLGRYDVEIRADAEAAWATEVARACASAGEGSGAISTYATHSDQLAIVGTKADLGEAVAACAQPLRDRSEAEKLNAECEIGDPDALVRGTSSFIGDCLIMYVIPFQWDSRTGECNFLGNWDSKNLGVRYSYKYDGSGLFQAGPTVCSVDLEEADQDDLLQVWVDVVGTYDYDTAAGGTNSVPQFEIVKAALIAKG